MHQAYHLQSKFLRVRRSHLFCNLSPFWATLGTPLLRSKAILQFRSLPQKLSMGELSQQLPLRLIDERIPHLAKAAWKS